MVEPRNRVVTAAYSVVNYFKLTPRLEHFSLFKKLNVEKKGF